MKGSIAGILIIFFMGVVSIPIAAEGMGNKGSGVFGNDQQKVKEVIDSMIDAYSSRNAANFMSLVSEGFAGDKTILDRAIRRDLSIFTRIDIRYTINNVTSAKDKIFVSLNFTRAHALIGTGANDSSSGTTEMVFMIMDNSPKLYSMKNPLIFGISDPSVATGNVVVK